MYGEGELLAETESKILQLNLNMEVQPFQSDIFEILKDVDILVMTSDNEGTPLTVMQASCAGVPCIGTDVGSMRDIVTDGVNGFLVDTDYVSIANEIEKLVSNLNELSSLQNSSIFHAKRHFDIKNFIEAHENIYLTLVNRGKSLSR
jgi:glycosyltransferase involved in cell wall biosynthesis